MSHLETLLSERQQAKRHERNLHLELESQVKERTAELGKVIKDLRQEILQRAELEEVLRESEAQYRLLFMDNPDPMWIVDVRSTRILAVNHSALRQYGFERKEFMRLTPLELVPVEQALALSPPTGSAPAPVSRHYRHYRKDGEPMDMEVTTVDLTFGRSLARLIMAKDAGERRRRELQVLQAQKNETIGRLAGGFAHHFNNILAIIDGYANLLLRSGQDTKTIDPLKQISTATNRAAILTQQLLAVAGRQFIHPRSVHVNDILERLSPAFGNLLGPAVVLKTVLAEDLPPIFADARLLEQALLNLVVNAGDAMPNGGTLTIHTASVELDVIKARRHPHARPGAFVRVGIRDTGCGISSEVQAHLFEPFFTTRDVGRSTGLGLATVSGAMKQSSGWIEYTTEVGQGTEFTLFFPCTSDICNTA
jgi:PAS domain S-box-containing protein